MDLANAHVLALDYLAKGNDSNQFNLGSANGFSVKQMVEAAREATGKEIPAEVGPRLPVILTHWLRHQTRHVRFWDGHLSTMMLRKSSRRLGLGTKSTQMVMKTANI